MSGTYQPISCVNHERLEFASLKRQWLDIEVLGGKLRGMHRLLPLDVYARDGEEWLVVQNASGEKLMLRLDWIGKFSEA